MGKNKRSKHQTILIVTKIREKAIGKDEYDYREIVENEWTSIYADKAEEWGSETRVTIRNNTINPHLRLDIRALDINNHIIWTETNSIPPNSSEIFYLDREVVALEARVRPSDWMGYLNPQIATVDVKRHGTNER